MTPEEKNQIKLELEKIAKHTSFTCGCMRTNEVYESIDSILSLLELGKIERR